MFPKVILTKQPRKDALYSREELSVINVHKEEYRQQTTRELRAEVFKTKILLDLFNFWLSKGRAPVGEEESRKCMKVRSNLGRKQSTLIYLIRNWLYGSEITGVHTHPHRNSKPVPKSMLLMLFGKAGEQKLSKSSRQFLELTS